jgi:hypothetical protein
MPRTRVLAAMLLALALVAVGAAVASASPTTTHTRYALRATLAPAPHAIGAAHAHGRVTGSITLDGTTGTLRWTLTYTGLTGPATMAHIHLAPSGKILIPLCAPCHTGHSGSFSGQLGGRSQILKAILGGQSYVNVHTGKNPAGEIRGYLHAAAAQSGY